MQDTKILYIASEIEPFLPPSPISNTIRALIEAYIKQRSEIRIFLPRFGIINQTKHKIHNIFRLYGINIPLGREDISLVVKSASIAGLKTQAYFVDNEDLFQQKHIFQDEDGNWYQDNDIRSIFFCKSVLAAIKELSWSPDIIHCHGWFAAFVPMYLKTAYKNTPIFKNTKCMYTFYPEQIGFKFDQDLYKKTRLREVKEEHLTPIGKGDFQGLMNLAATFSDACTRNFEHDHNYSPEWIEKFNVDYIPQDENLSEAYMRAYQKL